MNLLNFKKISIKLILASAFFLFAASVNNSFAQTTGVNFLIDPSYDSSGRNTITATDRFDGQNAYFYIEDDYWQKLNPADQALLTSNTTALAQEFDNVIYPSMRQFYGSEWTPGIDNDPKIYILLTNIIKDAGGYFNPNDEYYKNQVKNGKSNEKEVIYLNVNFIGKTNARPFLAHEFQHMINWYQKKMVRRVDEDIWLNEALSEYASTLLGYDEPFPQSTTESRVKTFLQDPSDSLTEWKNTNQDYASVNLFMQFLADHYGKNILKTIVASAKTGTAAIDDALNNLNYKTSFSEIFNNWIIANYLNDESVKGGAYSYLNQNLGYDTVHVPAIESFTLKDESVVKSIEYTKDWSGKWYQFNSSASLNLPNLTLKINFSPEEEDTKFEIPYITKSFDGTVSVNSFTIDSEQKSAVYVNNFGTAIKSVVIMPISKKKITGFAESEPLVKFSYAVSVMQQGVRPIIYTVSPNNSPVEGGVLITISGENFASDSIVTFGGIRSGEITVPDSKTIITKSPASFKNPNVKIEVTNPNSPSAVAPEDFYYLSSVKDGSLIRADGDFKVYVVKGRYKRWIQSPKIFKMYNFDWNSVITVAPQLRDYYETSSLVRADGDYKVYEINGDRTKHHLEMTAEQFSASGRSWDAIFTISKAERNLYRTGAAITK